MLLQCLRVGQSFLISPAGCSRLEKTEKSLLLKTMARSSLDGFGCIRDHILSTILGNAIRFKER